MRERNKSKTLIVLTGPTAVGKTQTSITIAQQLGAEIISADARQFFKELKIGTAAPTTEELTSVKHHLTSHLSIFEYYNASIFQTQALKILDDLFVHSDYAVVTGGSGLYIDALCYGIDKLPDMDPTIRLKVQQMYIDQGIEGLQNQLCTIDPEYFAHVDKANPNRMMRGIEVFLATGIKFSELRKKQTVQRPFNIKKVVLNLPRHQLVERINLRTEEMVKQGIIEEALSFFKYKHLNALNTVGYKELFEWMENRCDLKTAIENIKTNTRRYAKRQITWFKKYDDAKWFLPSETREILRYIKDVE